MRFDEFEMNKSKIFSLDKMRIGKVKLFDLGQRCLFIHSILLQIFN